MSQLISLCTGKSFDTTKQVVEKNQIIQMSGYHDDRFVVYDIVTTKWGLSYQLINLRTKTFGQCDLIQPLSEKFGIGYYFDDVTPNMMDAFEVAILKSEAEQNRQAELEKQQQKDERIEQLKIIGRERFKAILPANAQAIIIAEERQNDSEPMTDYYGHHTTRTVILGFSTHKRDLFSEMRKYAGNFEGTAYLAEYNADYENREKYSMGAGYYLGASKYSGWVIEKEKFYGTQEQIIERYALIVQGMFVGAVSDNFDERIEQKIFHAEIVVDNDAVARETKAYKKIPDILDFRDSDGNDTMQEEIESNYNQIKADVKKIVAEELQRISEDDDLKHLIKKE